MKLLFLFAAAVLFGAARIAQADAPAAPSAAPQPTVAECEGPSEMVGTDTETIVTLHDHVVVTGTDLKLYCDWLRVVETRKGDPGALVGKYGKFKSLLAVGHVRIIQTDREAVCGRAEVFPGEDRIVLSDNPVVRNPTDNYEARGYRMILYRGQRRAVIEAAPGERTRILLPPVKNLGFQESETPDPASPSGDPSR